ncbi:MAG: 3-phosphoshikimate 1-carboxyvinyltransferase [bacterium]|nr:3-phosphoshikimate 1-carboxyvinyltransferase [bacterium]
MDFIYKKRNPVVLNTTITDIPGDKSISHRSIIIGSLANNKSSFHNFLFSEDCINTINIFRDLGVKIETNLEAGTIQTQGVGLYGLRPCNKTLYTGNSGTSIRLISGILAGQKFDSEITGDSSIEKRPMKRIVEPLSLMNAEIYGNESLDQKNIFPPLHIKGNNLIKGMTYTLPVASAQVKSAVLLAALYTRDDVNIIEPAKCRDHTELMLKYFGVNLFISNNKISCSGPRQLQNPSTKSIYIPSDISSAAFFIVLGCLLPDSRICIPKAGLNKTRSRILDILIEMNARITISNVCSNDLEMYGDIAVESSSLKNIRIREEDIPFIIDEIPVLAIAALFGKGKLKITGAKELRVKESDRIASIVHLVSASGGKIIEYEDGFEIEGGSELHDFECNSSGDHRIAMSAVIAAIAANVNAVVKNCSCINTSFPDFFDIVKKLTI